MNAKSLVLMVGLLVAAASANAADLMPDSVDAEVNHVSHALQHFGKHRENFGYQVASVVVEWDATKRLTITASEGVTISGCLDGQREVFEARVTYRLWSK